MDAQERLYQIALCQIKKVGYRVASKLIAHFGSARAVFESNARSLRKILKNQETITQAILNPDTVVRAAQVLDTHDQQGIQIITPWEANYPKRLRHTYNAPNLLYSRGSTDLNASKVLSIVGTRKATEYGKRFIETLLQDLSPLNILVISGLAYGIDIHAHRIALEVGLPTVAVVASSVDLIYPASHRKTVEMIMNNGSIISEYPYQTPPDTHQFATRNRIIAGMADATIVIEAGQKSGSLITANYANEYHRDVFAVPGNVYAPGSLGCHQLIKTHQASLLTDAADIINGLNWDKNHASIRPRSIEDIFELFPNLTESEKRTVATMKDIQAEEIHIDLLSYESKIPLNQLASTLLQLELKNIIRFLPGQKIRAVH